MKTRGLLALATLSLAMLAATAATLVAAPLPMSKNGVSPYRIAIGTDAPAIQKTAATELQKTFEEVTGAKLPVVEMTANEVAAGDALLVIGPSALSKKLLGDAIDESKFGYDTLCVHRCGTAVVFTGHALRGPLYAVNAFLEDTVGCRWWTSKESFIPKKPTLEVDAFDQLFTPKLIYRESFYRDVFNGAFAVKMRCNGAHNQIPEECGGHHRFHFFVHSFYPLIPPEKYFPDHPDWFPEIDGHRQVGYPEWSGPSKNQHGFLAKLKPEQISKSGTQLCLTNEEMRKEMVKNALASLKNDPKASFISISQNDWHGWCTCPKCAKIVEEEGAVSGLLLRFVNKVAEDIEKERPDIYVETLAYQQSRKPPKITRARHNVVVRLCSIECSFSQTLADGEQNKSFREDMEGWTKMADRLFVWDYMTDFALYLLPFPNYRVWNSNINFFVDHHTIGLFEQGDYHTETGDFTQLRAWVVAKMLWNPKLDQGELMNEFIAGYYAPELVPIYRAYFDTLSDAVTASGIHLRIFESNCTKWLPCETLIKATDLLNRARAIGTELERTQPEKYRGLVDKIERERIPLELVWLQDYPMVRLEARLSGMKFNGPDDPYKAAVAFAEKLKKYKLTAYRESMRKTTVADFADGFVKRYEGRHGDAPVPGEFAKLPKNSYLDLQEFDLGLVRKGEWTFIVEDPAASNKMAVKMPGTHYEWATSWSFSRFLPRLQPVSGNATDDGLYRVILYARCESKKPTSAMTAGIYDVKSKKSIVHRAFKTADFPKDGYLKIDLGTTKFLPEGYVWAAPAKGHDGLEAVYIDRVIVIREK